MVSAPKGAPMEDRSQLAERILDQVADAVIHANRSGAIIRDCLDHAWSIHLQCNTALGFQCSRIDLDQSSATHWAQVLVLRRNVRLFKEMSHG